MTKLDVNKFLQSLPALDGLGNTAVLDRLGQIVQQGDLLSSNKNPDFRPSAYAHQIQGGRVHVKYTSDNTWGSTDPGWLKLHETCWVRSRKQEIER